MASEKCLLKKSSSSSSSMCDMLSLNEEINKPPNMVSWDVGSSPSLTPHNSFVRQESQTTSEQTEAMTLSSDWPVMSSEQILFKSSLKFDLANCYRRLDNAFPLLASEETDTVQHGLDIVKQVSIEAWKTSEGPDDLVNPICKYIQKVGHLDILVDLFVSGQFDLRLQAGQVLEGYLSNSNAVYIAQRGYLRHVIKTIIFECDKKNESHLCLGVSLLESFFRNGATISKTIVDLGGLDYLIDVCRTQIQLECLLHAAVALSNLAVFSDTEVHRLMVKKQVPAWLFMLASHEDKRVQFYGILTACVLGANKEFEHAVREFGTFQVAVIYMKSTKPEDMARLDYKYRSGRSTDWLNAFSPFLDSTVPEVQAMALYQLLMEASLRKGSEKIKTLIQVFEKLGITAKIQQIAICPAMELSGLYADKLLTAFGEAIPYKLSLSVPLWTYRDVQYWLCKVGFGCYVDVFAKHRVDGDLLLRTTEQHLKNEIKMTSAYDRMRFMRELNSLKRSADYSCVDPTCLDMWLTKVDPGFSIYTYQMLSKGVDKNSLIHMNEQCLEEVYEMDNKIHRMKIIQAFREIAHVEEAELALLKKQVDIFISYRRSTGNQLASLIKVQLQLKGYKVFIDVDRLCAGKFDKSLLLNIKAAKLFIIVLTPHSLDGCIADNDCDDWLHLEIKTALESGTIVLPVLEKGFEWPPAPSLPLDMQALCTLNSIQWVHESQEACVEKVHRLWLRENSAKDCSGRTTKC